MSSTAFIYPSVSPTPTSSGGQDMDDISPYYKYIPTESVCIIFVSLFSLSTLLHIILAIKYRLWWLLPSVCLAGSCEVLGWAARLWSSLNPRAYTPFMIQIVTLALAPSLIIAAVFITFGRLIRRLGTQYSRLSPRLYAWIFLTCDTIALAIQGIGGGQAASAKSDEEANRGNRFLLAGIAFQLAALGIFIILATEVFVRSVRDWPVGKKAELADSTSATLISRDPWDIKLKLITFGITICTLFLFIRCVYRTIELKDGWGGRIISTQLYFNVLEGAMIVLAMYTLNIFHPGFFIARQYPEKRQEDETQISSKSPMV